MDTPPSLQPLGAAMDARAALASPCGICGGTRSPGRTSWLLHPPEEAGQGARPPLVPALCMLRFHVWRLMAPLLFMPLCAIE